MIERHYKTKELVELLAVSEDTILRLAQRGELASVYVGSERRYPESAVQAFLDRSRAPARNFPSASVVPLAATRDSGRTRTRRTR